MADIKKLVPKILKWEGGFGNDPADPGGATMWGVTIATYRSFFGEHKTVDDLKFMTQGEWMQILKKLFWDKWQADQIKSQSIAEILVDWVWASGAYGYKEPQKLLGLTPDGIVGPKTLDAINNYSNQPELHQRLYDARMAFIDRIVVSSVNHYKLKRYEATTIDISKFIEKYGIKTDADRKAAKDFFLKYSGQPEVTNKDLMTDTFLRFKQGWENRINDAYKNFEA